MLSLVVDFFQAGNLSLGYILKLNGIKCVFCEDINSALIELKTKRGQFGLIIVGKVEGKSELIQKISKTDIPIIFLCSDKEEEYVGGNVVCVKRNLPSLIKILDELSREEKIVENIALNNLITQNQFSSYNIH